MFQPTIPSVAPFTRDTVPPLCSRTTRIRLIYLPFLSMQKQSMRVKIKEAGDLSSSTTSIFITPNIHILLFQRSVIASTSLPQARLTGCLSFYPESMIIRLEALGYRRA